MWCTPTRAWVAKPTAIVTRVAAARRVLCCIVRGGRRRRRLARSHLSAADNSPLRRTRSRGLLGALLDRFGLVGADVRVDACGWAAGQHGPAHARAVAGAVAGGGGSGGRGAPSIQSFVSPSGTGSEFSGLGGARASCHLRYFFISLASCFSYFIDSHLPTPSIGRSHSRKFCLRMCERQARLCIARGAPGRRAGGGSAAARRASR